MFDLSFHKTPSLLAALFSAFSWKVSTSRKEIYLTFDDGPIPVLTEEILEILREFSIKATFFCVGENIEKYPEIFKKVIDEGHTIGNHTYNHLKAWRVSFDTYLDNIEKTDKAIAYYGGGNKKLFRPPYGQFTTEIYRQLIVKGYKVIMWDILTKDYLSHLNIQKAYQKCSSKSVPGSIVVFHDNLKARNNVLNLLPMYINKLLSEGYQFKSL